MKVLCALLALAAAPSPTRVAAPFSSQFELLLVSDSIWGHCDMTITVGERAEGTLMNACRSYDGPVARKKRRLQAGEIGELRALLRQANLFGRVSEGTDQRGIDLPLITLKVTADGRSAEMVCVTNPDFRSDGPRKRLLERLMTLYLETRDGSGRTSTEQRESPRVHGAPSGAENAPW